MAVTKSVAIKDGKAVQKKEKPSMMSWIESCKPQIAKALPSAITPERFTRIVMTAVSQKPELGQCTPTSFMGAMLTAAQLGLEPNTPLGQAYLIPYRNKGTLEVQFQIGYKGLIEMAHRSGEVKSIEAHVVRENDTFEYELGLEPKLRHVPAMRDRGNITWVYAVYKLTNGGYGFEVMSYEDIEAHRKQYSKAGGSYSPWNTAWEAMAKKTVLKRALKYAPMTTEFVKGAIDDESTLDFERHGDDYEITQHKYDDDQMVELDEKDIHVSDTVPDGQDMPGQMTIDADTGEVKE